MSRPWGWAGPDEGVEEEGGLFAGVVFDGGEFFEDDAAFAFDFFFEAGGVLDHVEEEVEAAFGEFGGDFAVVDGHFAVGGGVDGAADGVDFEGDVAGGGAALGAFEADVFEEVGDAGGFVVFLRSGSRRGSRRRR